MYARVTTMQVRLEKLDDAIRIVRESVLPAAREHPGFRRLQVFVDRETGSGMIVSEWDSADSLAASEAGDYLQANHANLVGHLTEPPIIQSYEIALSE